MKRILLAMTSVLLLTGCSSPVTITPDIVDVQVSSIKFVEENVVLDLYITNGTSDRVDIVELELWYELPSGYVLNADETLFCGAVYTINRTVEKDEYLHFEVVFEPGYIFMTAEQLTTMELTLEDLVLHFDIT